MSLIDAGFAQFWGSSFDGLQTALSTSPLVIATNAMSSHNNLACMRRDPLIRNLLTTAIGQSGWSEVRLR